MEPERNINKDSCMVWSEQTVFRVQSKEGGHFPPNTPASPQKILSCYKHIEVTTVLGVTLFRCQFITTPPVNHIRLPLTIYFLDGTLVLSGVINRTVTRS